MQKASLHSGWMPPRSSGTRYAKLGVKMRTYVRKPIVQLEGEKQASRLEGDIVRTYAKGKEITYVRVSYNEG